MTRFEAVSGAIRAQLAMPHAYGSADCFFLPLAVVDALHGTAHMAAYRGCYTTQRGALRALRRRGHDSLATFFRDAIGLEPIPAAMARLGDIAVLRIGAAEAGAVMNGNGFMTRTERGTAALRHDAVMQAFRV